MTLDATLATAAVEQHCNDCQSHSQVPPEVMGMPVWVKGLLRVRGTGSPGWVKDLADR